MGIRRGAIRPTVAVAFAVAICVVVIGRMRPQLTERLSPGGERVQDDLYVLPSPERLGVLSLGYRSALADLL